MVITGGGSLLKGTRELAAQVLGTEVNLGIPQDFAGGGLVKEVESPIYATGIGLILHRIKYLMQRNSTTKRGRKKPGVKNILHRIKQWFDEL